MRDAIFSILITEDKKRTRLDLFFQSFLSVHTLLSFVSIICRKYWSYLLGITMSFPFLDPLQIRNPVKSETMRRIRVGLIVIGKRTTNIKEKVIMNDGIGELETVNTWLRGNMRRKWYLLGPTSH